MALPTPWFIIAMSIKFTLNLKSNIFSLQDSKLEWESHKQEGNDTLQGWVTSSLTLPNKLFSLVQCVETYRKYIYYYKWYLPALGAWSQLYEMSWGNIGIILVTTKPQKFNIESTGNWKNCCLNTIIIKLYISCSAVVPLEFFELVFLKGIEQSFSA